MTVRVDWKARAEREAAAILDGSEPFSAPFSAASREYILILLSIAWLQGVNLGCHETLSDVEQSFDRMLASL